MFKVVMIQNGYERPCSYDLPSYRAALQWVRDYWTREDGELVSTVRIVRLVKRA